MNEKYNFFKEAYEKTLKKRDSLKSNFLNMIKLTPFFFGSSYFLWTQKEMDIVFTGDSLNFYNFVLVIQFLLLVSIFLYAGITYLYPPDYKILARPRKLSDHWDNLERYNAENGITDSTLTAMEQSLLPQYIENADFNDAWNISMGKRLTKCGLLLILWAVCIIVLILNFALRASNV